MGSVLKVPSVLSGRLLLFTTIFTSPRTGSLGTWKGLPHIDSDDRTAGTWVCPLLLEFYQVGALMSSSPGGGEKQEEGSAGKKPSGRSLSSSPQPLWVSCSKAEGRPRSLLRFRGKAEKCSAAASLVSNLKGEVSKFQDPDETCLHTTIIPLL